MVDGQGMLEGLEMKGVFGEIVDRERCIGRGRRFHADRAPQVQVTLSADMLNHLRMESQSSQIPLRWLVAGLVCDTMESGVEPSRWKLSRGRADVVPRQV